MNEILSEIRKLDIESRILRRKASDIRTPYEKAQILRKRQDDAWKKLQFYKKLASVKGGDK